MALIVAACGGSEQPAGHPFPVDAPRVEATAEVTPHRSSTCSGTFAAHDLDHVTSGPGETSSTFDGTGSGVAIGDLDGDDDLDLVLANLSGATNILRNDGDLVFSAEPLIVGRFRQPAVVDVDGDDDLDIVLSSGVGPPLLLDNQGDDVGFERGELAGVRAATYSMAWSDLGGDGDIDLVTGSYNAELTSLRNTPVVGSDTGVVVHERDGSTYEATRIAAAAQALTVRLVDLNGDFRPDILVGNDLQTADGVWLDNDGGWLAVDRFESTSFSTMSLDAGDVDNDGDLDIFSSDMRPRPDDASAAARYAEVDDDMAALSIPDEIQRPENVLSLADGEGFDNATAEYGVAATGWSWSAVFGDLDADGRLDLYVVTGMVSENLFPTLPGHELIEPNQVFANTGVMERRPEWGLDDTTGGRGMAMADLDGDGDLDIVVNNLDAPARLFENQLCGGANLTIDLRWPDSANTDALGAMVAVTADGRRSVRTIDAARGYLSSGPPSAHVGLGDHTGPVEVAVLWPDGSRSDLTDVSASSHVTITRRS